MNELLNKLPSPMELDKKEILDLLLKEEYGIIPSSPYSVSATVKKSEKNFCAGKAELLTLSLNCKADWGEFSFPLYYVRPLKAKAPVPCFIHVNFRDLIPDKYQPTEELVDNGYATLTFCYNDVTQDNDDFSDGLAGVIYPDGKQTEDGCGKIGLWAWAACAVMDYAVTLSELDKTRICIAGHSRLGKTALLAGAMDDRFYCAFSNDSGCSGAAISRNKGGETIKLITQKFPFWFGKNYIKYADNEDALPFDQHYLIAANAPHKVYVASAVGDTWACPENEYLSCVAATEYYKSHGLTGFIHPDCLPVVGDSFHEGDIGYHMRDGLHYFSREDWLIYLKYLERHNSPKN